MSLNIAIAVTDGDWFDMLRQQPNLDEVNFWAPSAANFRALRPGELFLFKLHAPRNFIVGGGIFAYANGLPCSLAWDAFREANGARSAQEMRTRIARYRRVDPGDRGDFEIGWLREAFENRVPIIYFLGIAPGRYQAIVPTFVSGWDAGTLKARIAFGVLDQEALAPPENALERRYALRSVKQRLHQATFREAVPSFGKLMTTS